MRSFIGKECFPFVYFSTYSFYFGNYFTDGRQYLPRQMGDPDSYSNNESDKLFENTEDMSEKAPDKP